MGFFIGGKCEESIGKREIPWMGVHSFFYKLNIINKFALQTTFPSTL
jgi:hypothetical protein